MYYIVSVPDTIVDAFEDLDAAKEHLMTCVLASWCRYNDFVTVPSTALRWLVEFPVGYESRDNLYSVSYSDIVRKERLEWFPGGSEQARSYIENRSLFMRWMHQNPRAEFWMRVGSPVELDESASF